MDLFKSKKQITADSDLNEAMFNRALAIPLYNWKEARRLQSYLKQLEQSNSLESKIKGAFMVHPEMGLVRYKTCHNEYLKICYEAYSGRTLLSLVTSPLFGRSPDQINVTLKISDEGKFLFDYRGYREVGTYYKENRGISTLRLANLIEAGFATERVVEALDWMRKDKE